MSWQTHTVFNQPAPLNNSNLFLSDGALCEAVSREGAGWDSDLLASIGQQLGTAESLELGRLANAHPPELLRYDPQGQRLDDVRFHPAWHLLMQGLCANRVHNLAWEEEARAGSFVARAARFVLHAQVEAGTLCPVTMTFAATPLLLQMLPTTFHDWLAPLRSDRYDSHLLPGGQKRGLLIGMGMTEKQGGSDVLSNTTHAERLADDSYRLVGHKWFFSVPQSDAHLVLAQAKGGLSCFFVPRFLPDGQRNSVRLERLKDKLGNRSNASAEVEFQDAVGWRLGEEGEGIRHILKMGGMTRLDCALGSHGLMRRAFSVAIYHAHQRQAFGKPLIEQPLMRQTLSRMALCLEGQTALLFRLARAWEQRREAKEALWARLFTPAAKFAICKQGIPFVAEAMEVLGGMGYCEESELPRLYREMPVNSIWEGSGNIMCLDVLRVLTKQHGVYDVLSEVFTEVKGQDRHYDRAVRQLQQRLRKPDEAMGREITQQLFLLGCGAEMLRHASPPLAQAWCQMMLDTRGEMPLPAQVQNDLLLRATGGLR
ncbi:TPA: isovaleryl-CoA dehydrogenase [Salmonella enterica subsp. enterica serovar Liverpool]|uniref:Isovaleryl-CoA dehydrogenase n=1 Tax=Salmonella enterica subsp. enterica serovar Cerro TaxID=340188 RepID=A0A5W2AXT5_SALET|nr:isovaleryl-CoA dehydrogenase [Salmonella enterica]EAA2344151.1 isovaleryl-CoA dehydrogenase [Salmonella enterica subsp. enterica serovar Montevideo]EAW1768585.1 isovaleryl-CoA dehydrogenase [Salmonella enterica subsp. enterica]EDS3105133.1 isovaleryl-CoA dehydrogenase [Salmonella enterica subsp. enterica serovar Cullingworth]EEC6780802.1 isovaleryl-CoA dehydrogenase [Salmonella enterica subsp. enterica serovar Olten]EHG1540274.1 isovaleryl-CoA dehydrogenase [Salmonella enterica subsp. enter